jgi:16S rRNA (adenine1518-N6/adenine1519-N6)-dimethyltransferase
MHHNRVKPKKSLGQHFLKNMEVAKKIADTIADYQDVPILEVGPGMGVLTQFLIQNHHDFTVVEIDQEAVHFLQQHFPDLNGRILNEDFLKMNLAQIFPHQFCVIGNYPYHISSQIIFKVLDFKEQVVCCTGMFQKEVAQRFAAPPGSKTYGITSALVQPWYDVEYLFTVGPEVFDPPPNVQSAVIRLTRNNRQKLNCNEILYKRVVKTTFNQRRKTLRNSVKPLLHTNPFDSTNPIFDLRPEQLSIEQFVDLTNIIENYLHDSNSV